MIELYEQFDGCIGEHNTQICDTHSAILDEMNEYSKSVIRLGEDALCFNFRKCNNTFHFQTSYFVGIDWIAEGKLSIYVSPKQNCESSVEIDYLNMLTEALQEEGNINHLTDLVHIEFNKPHIKINQQQDMLSIFLVAEYLHLIRRIVRKGLRKAYYNIEENLNSKIKGKILIGKNIATNTLKGKNSNIYCRYQEYGIDTSENRILKRALSFACRVLLQYKSIDIRHLSTIAQTTYPAFCGVSDKIGHNEIVNYVPSPLYKEYSAAIKIAKLILKRYSYNITKTEQQIVSTPPFWIDMSKLFELYVFKKLRDVFTSKEIEYHLKVKRQELDYLLNPQNKSLLPFVIDAKYKPRYHNKSIDTVDIRQVCGYARLKRVYDKLKITDYRKNIDCLIIYPHQECADYISLNDDLSTFAGTEPANGYVGIYKLGIRLPETNKSEK